MMEFTNVHCQKLKIACSTGMYQEIHECAMANRTERSKGATLQKDSARIRHYAYQMLVRTTWISSHSCWESKHRARTASAKHLTVTILLRNTCYHKRSVAQQAVTLLFLLLLLLL
jgi:hypothetical protein